MHQLEVYKKILFASILFTFFVIIFINSWRAYTFLKQFSNKILYFVKDAATVDILASDKVRNTVTKREVNWVRCKNYNGMMA